MGRCKHHKLRDKDTCNKSNYQGEKTNKQCLNTHNLRDISLGHAQYLIHAKFFFPTTNQKLISVDNKKSHNNGKKNAYSRDGIT